MKVSNGLNLQGQPITNLPTTPTDPNEAASKAYVDANAGGAGSQEVFVQQTRPITSGPWTWWVTNANNQIIDLIINDGV